MLNRLPRSVGRSGWRGIVMLALLPVVDASWCTAFWAHGAVRSIAGGAYCIAAAAVLVLAWQISFGGRDV